MLPNDHTDSEGCDEVRNVSDTGEDEEQMNDSQVESEEKEEQNQHEIEIAKQMAIVQYHRVSSHCYIITLYIITVTVGCCGIY